VGEELVAFTDPFCTSEAIFALELRKNPKTGPDLEHIKPKSCNLLELCTIAQRLDKSILLNPQTHWTTRLDKQTITRLYLWEAEEQRLNNE